MEVPKAWQKTLKRISFFSHVKHNVFKMFAEPLPVPTQSSQIPVQG